MAWRERTGLVVLVLVALVLASVPATIGGMAEPTGLDEPPLRAGSAWSGPDMDQFQAAMAWSSANEASLLSPLLPGAGLYGLMDETLHAYEDGQAWAEHRLAVEDRASLEAGLAALLAPYGVAPRGDGVAEIPAAWVAPVATLVRAQLQHDALVLPAAPAGAGTLPPGPSLAAIEENLARGAWLLGVVDVVEPVLDAAREVLPEEPILVDPVGLVIIGGTGDNVYEKPDLPAWWNGAILVVEPGGHDTYHVNVADTPSVVADVDERHAPVFPIAVELDGNDRYLEKASAGRGLLLDQRGDDRYGSEAIGSNVAKAGPGRAFLFDREGHDTYMVQDHGIAYASAPFLQANRPSLAVLADWAGDDQYLADTGQKPVMETHARAVEFGALAILRDYAGDDTYRSNALSQASVKDGGIALLIDDEGDDHHYVFLHSMTSYGMRNLEDGGLAGPGNRGLAYYLDGNGKDSFDHDRQPDPHSEAGDGVQRIYTGEEHAWSVFWDCETPEDADFPCEQAQEEIARDVLNSIPVLPRNWLPE